MQQKKPFGNSTRKALDKFSRSVADYQQIRKIRNTCRNQYKADYRDHHAGDSASAVFFKVYPQSYFRAHAKRRLNGISDYRERYQNYGGDGLARRFRVRRNVQNIRPERERDDR